MRSCREKWGGGRAGPWALSVPGQGTGGYFHCRRDGEESICRREECSAAGGDLGLLEGIGK